MVGIKTARDATPKLCSPGHDRDRLVRLAARTPSGRPGGVDRRLTTPERDAIAGREAAQRKPDLVATVSHELRTPLASVLGFVELLHRP